jgi:zinc protease
MVKFERCSLNNGLRIIVHEDRSTPLVAMNILYNVGSRDEDPEMTGLAHLFEHLMFGGSKNIPDFDTPLLMVGGENNAFTNNDITNYYLTIPSVNIETGFWLESDRMFELDFSQKNLDIQRKVVSEEFNQRYLNQPYGDAMLILRALAYNVHPYRWPAIGRDVNHILKVNLRNIKDFFFSHYSPDNAILSLTGNISADKAFRLSEKWFGPIEKRNVKKRILPAEPKQMHERKLIVEKDVPSSALYKAWHIGPRESPDFHTFDLITDLLAGGDSGRLYNTLVREKKLFSEINAYITSDIDPGLVILSGKLMNNVNIKEAEKEVDNVITGLLEKQGILKEMEKVKNKYEASAVFSNTNILNKAMTLAYCELLGDAELINREIESYKAVTHEMVVDSVSNSLIHSNCSTLYYNSKRKDV